MTPQQIVDAAFTLIGTPFHHQGRVPGVGVDCIGVPIIVARMMGLVANDFDVSGYSAMPDGVELMKLADQYMQRSDSDEVGGVTVVAWRDGPPQHFGVVVPHPHGGLGLIHADSMRQKCVTLMRIEYGRYMRRVQSYRMPGVTY